MARLMTLAVLASVVVVSLSSCSLFGSDASAPPIDYALIEQADDGLLILATEYPNDRFDASYSEQSRSFAPSATCEVIVHEILGISAGSCREPMAERSIAYTSNGSFGAAGYLLFWSESHAIDYLELVNGVASVLENDTRTVQRDYLSDITRTGLGPAADEVSYVYLVTDDHNDKVHLSLIRMNRSVFYVYEQTPDPVLNRRFSSLTWPSYYGSVIERANLSYASLE